MNDDCCKACGAEAGELWETDTSRLTSLSLATFLHDTPLHAQSEEDVTTLCNECSEGFAQLRAKWAHLN